MKNSYYYLIPLAAFAICHYFFPEWVLPAFAALTIQLLINISNNLYDIGNEIIKQLRIIKMRQGAFFKASEKHINAKDYAPVFPYDDPCDDKPWRD